MRPHHPLKCFSYDPKGSTVGSDPAEVRPPAARVASMQVYKNIYFFLSSLWTLGRQPEPGDGRITTSFVFESLK